MIFGKSLDNLFESLVKALLDVAQTSSGTLTGVSGTLGTVSSQVGDALASLSTLIGLGTTANTLQASTRDTLDSTLTTQTSALQSSISAQTGTLNTSIGNNTTTLQSELQTIDTTLGALDTTVQTEVQAQTAAVLPEVQELVAALYGPQVDSFGRQRVSEPLTIFDSKLLFDSLPLLWDDQELSGSGTASVHNAARAQQELSVAANTAGRRVRQTFMRFNYQPGKSQLVFLTGTLLSGGGLGVTRRTGLYDDENGVYMEDSEGIIYAVIRSSTTGVAVESRVPYTAFNIDPLDGTGPSGLTIDPFQSQIVVFDIEWLGVGTVRIGFVIDGRIYYGHKFHHANLTAGVYMSTPNLPLRYEIINDGTGVASSVAQICSTVISEGGATETGVPRSVITPVGVNVSSTGTTYLLLALRLKSSHIGATILLKSFSAILLTADDARVSVLWNPTIAGTVTYVSQSNSAVQAATGSGNANSVTGGTLLESAYFSNALALTQNLSSALRLGANLAGERDVVALCLTPLSSNVACHASLNWKEIL